LQPPRLAREIDEWKPDVALARVIGEIHHDNAALALRSAPGKRDEAVERRVSFPLPAR
jgi:hypothetical protein